MTERIFVTLSFLRQCWGIFFSFRVSIQL